jgi:hypothetical protein
MEGLSKGDLIHHSEAYKRVEKAMKSISVDPEELYTVTFHLDLSLKNFFKLDIQHPEDLESLLYLSGSGSTAFASTCREYVDLFWGDEGWQFVQRLAHARGRGNQDGRQSQIYSQICHAFNMDDQRLSAELKSFT